MTLDIFLATLTTSPDKIEFTDTMTVIESLYDFIPTQFSNGDVTNLAGDNNGSCKIFAFGLAQDLTQQQTLACFGRYYRDDVLANPKGNDHPNIRHFIDSGWQGISFKGQALVVKEMS
jgi:hypothetical protein